MRSDNDHREQLDDFSEFMKRKLENHRLPVDDFCWEELEPRMKPRRKSFIWWIGSSVAAAVAMLLLLLPFGQEEIPADRISEQVTVVPEQTTTPPVDKIPTSKTLIAAIAEKQPVAEQVVKEEAGQEQEMVSETDHAVAEAPKAPEASAETKKSEEPKQVKQQDLNHYDSKKYTFASPERAEKKGKDWSVNASFGTGGHVSLGLSGDNAAYEDMQGSENPGGITPPIVPPPFTNGEILPVEEYTNIDCALPLSFGLTVRRDFSRYIGVETGLVYTYLSSRMTKGGSNPYNSRLDLHYLGIPVNLVVNLWSNPKWNIYLSGGVMLEKGLRSKLTQERLSFPTTETLVEKKGVGGVQWSLNFSAGVSYRLHRDWSIYFEPRLSRYLENDQPVSIRTENSVIVGLGGGFRFAF